MRFRGTYREEGWRRCGAMAATDGLRFTPWPHERLPGWSLPALEAAKCVARQGSEPFDRFHLGAYRALFTESRDIADRAVLAALAGEAGAEVERFVGDLDAGVGRDAVAADYEAALAEGIQAIPTVIVQETGRRLVGLADLDAYRAAVAEALT